MERLNGLGTSPGVAIGRAVLMPRSASGGVRVRVSDATVPAELERLRQAVERTREQLKAIKGRVERAAGEGHGYLFDAQMLMLDDPMLVHRAGELVRAEHLNAEWALHRAGEDLAALLGSASDVYLRERGGDVSDVVSRLKSNLHQTDWAPALTALADAAEGQVILVTDELRASVAAQMDWSRIAGFVSERGSRTQHTAILARSMRVPAVVGLQAATQQVAPGAMLVVDGTTGDVVVDPSEATLVDARARQQRHAAAERSLGELRALPAETQDGITVRLLANIERPDEVARAREYGAEGIGLYRSEFLLAGVPAEEPTEDTQYDVYRALVEQMAPEPVTIRSFDAVEHAGGRLDAVRGLRATRSAPAGLDRMRTQLRALCRAAVHGRLRLMFPQVGGVEELREARGLLEEARSDVREGGVNVPSVPVGVMIEVPSAALTADLLAAEADFLSVGTNDLVHYTLAVDRADVRASELYEPLHPAVLRMLRAIQTAAAGAARPLSICGEMASDPAMLPLLVGLGITELSMTPAAIPLAKQVLRKLVAAEARALADAVLRCGTVREIEGLLAEHARQHPAGTVKG